MDVVKLGKNKWLVCDMSLYFINSYYDNLRDAVAFASIAPIYFGVACAMPAR